MPRYQILLDRVRQEFPNFKIVRKTESFLFKYILFFIPKRYTTTIGAHMYVTSDWDNMADDKKYIALRHEKTHTKQFYNWPFGQKYYKLNRILCGFCYVFILPFFYTFRSMFEREAYTQTLLAKKELGQMEDWTIDDLANQADRLAEEFGTSNYFWMWTKSKAYDWAVDVINGVRKGEIKSDPKDVVP